MDKAIQYCTQYDISRAGMNMTWPLENQGLFTALLVIAALIPVFFLVLKLKGWNGVFWSHIVMFFVMVWPLSIGFYYSEVYRPVFVYDLLLDKLAHHDFKVVEGEIKAVKEWGRYTEFLVADVNLRYGDAASKQGLVNKHLDYKQLEKGQFVRVQYMDGTFLNIFGSTSGPDSDNTLGRTITKLEVECPDVD